MKKMVLIIIGILLVLGLVIGVYLVFNHSNDGLYGHTPRAIHSGKKMNISRDDTLVVYHYSNYAWSAQYNGMAIVNDGTIYSWNLTGNIKNLGNYNVNSADGLKNYILENGKLENKKISAKDLEKI